VSVTCGCCILVTHVSVVYQFKMLVLHASVICLCYIFVSRVVLCVSVICLWKMSVSQDKHNL
jgi:hypothetical protein